MSNTVTSINQPATPIIQRALLSVADKTGIVNFAQGLHKLGIIILSTGGTASLLRQHQVPVVEVAEYTGFPEILNGRVKTLHPKIHGGLLARGVLDAGVLRAQAIEAINLLVVNLYPFQQTIANADCSLAEAIDNIDIGGPAMLRAAAKNYVYTAAVVTPTDYAGILTELIQTGALSATTRFELARKAFAYTAQYDGAIANYLGRLQTQTNFPPAYSWQVYKKQALRYGENPHQQGAFYTEAKVESGSISCAVQLQGQALSYNNIADANTALECVKSFALNAPTCVIVKHANPCGAATADTQLEAYQKAYQADPSSAFGGIIAFNTALQVDTVLAIIKQQFAEVLIAPAVSAAVLAITAQKPKLRVMRCGAWSTQIAADLHYHTVNSGLLVQQRDELAVSTQQLSVVSQRQPTPSELKDLQFAWCIAKFVKSNAIVYAKNQMTIGIGGGQTSRIMSAKIASWKADEAKLMISGAVMASDAFLPFRDTVDVAVQAGITAIIQPGGSIRDAAIIAASDEQAIAMVFTGIRHFRH